MNFKKQLISLLILLGFSIGNLNANTTLSVGDIAFIGLNTDSNDDFTFVLLVDIDATTEIRFTDYGYDDGSGFNTLISGDGELVWTSGTALTAGTTVTITESSTSASVGSVSGNMTLSSIGDQLFAFQGSLASPTIITGIHLDVIQGVPNVTTTDANWSGGSFSDNETSALPDVLTNGVNALRVHDSGTETDNWQYNCTVVSGDPATLRAAIHNVANWTPDNGTAFSPIDPGCSWSVAASCTDPDTPSSLSATPSTICPSASSTISWSGSLNDATAWHVYTSSCGVGQLTTTTGNSLVVTPGTTTTYFIRGEDGAGCVDESSISCGQITVTVSDAMPPIVTCPSNQNLSLDGSCQASLPDYTSLATTSDNCDASPTVTQSPASGTIISGAGTATTVTLTSTDASTNSSQCTFTVTVVDNIDPNAVCQNVNIYLDGAGNATIVAADLDGGSTDNCGGVTLGASQTAFTCADLGPNNVTLTATDGSNNTANCVAVVTVLDTISPVIINCNPLPAAIPVDANCQVLVPVLTTFISATDNCDPSSVITQSPTAGSIVTVGTTTVTIIARDASGNTGTCSIDVIVEDQMDPSTPTLSNVTGECTATASAPTTTDNCAGTITGTTTDPLTYTAQGTHTITWTFDDGNGNSTTATQDVVIDDVTDPSTPTLSNVTGECTATAVAPTTTDNCAGTITGTTTDPLTYNTQGTHTITWTFDDGNGNSTTATQDVVIDDVTDPSTPTLSNVTGECTATAVAPTTTDNCAGTITGTTTDPLTYNTQGTHTITWTFDDGNGNSTTATQDVVIDDVTDPSTPTLSNVTGECTATAVAPTTTDNCAGTITGTTTDPLTYNTQGTHTITWTFDDGNGNSTTATQDVVIDDVTDPSTPTLSNVTGECTATAVAPTTTDNCAGTITGTTTDPLTYNTQGTHTITWTFDDGNGNSITATQDVVIDDVTDPVVSCPANEVLNANSICNFWIGSVPPTSVTDNCSIVDTTWTLTGATSATGTNTFKSFPVNLGITTVTYTVTDDAGNSGSCDFTIEVVDVTDPDMPTLSNVTGECTATATAPTTTDNCAGTVTGTTSDPLIYNTQGTHTITWTFDDGNGNSITATQDVVIDDVTDPTISCPSNQIIPSPIPVVVNYSVPTGNDNCAGFNVVLTQGLGDGGTFPFGVNMEEYTVTDIGGNIATCSFTITVDNTTSIVEEEVEISVLYPNPTNGIVSLTIPYESTKIIVFDIYGRKIEERRITLGKNELDFTGYSPAVYHITIMNDNKRIETKRIVIRR